MNAIARLESLGFSVSLEGDRIRYIHQGELPDLATVRALLVELKQHKAEAIHFLRERANILPHEPPAPSLLSDWPQLCESLRRLSYPKVIEWPGDYPPTGDAWGRTGDKLLCRYNSADSLESGLWAVAMLKETQTLGA